MYLVTIINDNEEIKINTVSTDNQENKIIGGTIKQGINSFDSFTFTIYMENEGFYKINPFKTRIKVLNVKTNKFEFIGRALPPEKYMDESGICGKKVTCESELAFLVDSMQDYGEYHNITIQQYLKTLLDVHNSKLEESKKIKLGNVTVKDKNDSIYKYTNYKSTWENIKTDLIDVFGGEITLRYDENGDERYLDYLTEIGEDSTTEIKLGYNMKSISEKPDVDGFYTRIKVLGAKLKKKDSSGKEEDTEERLTIKFVNNGKDYLDYEEAVTKYGIIEGVIAYDDVTEASNLLSKGKEYISSLKLNVNNTISALDLSLIGLDIDSFKVGNYYKIKNDLLEIESKVRIIEKTINIDNPQQSSVSLGDKQFNINEYYKDKEKTKNVEANLASVNSNINEVKKQMQQIEKKIDKNVKEIETIQNKEGSYVEVNTYNRNLKEINENFTKLQKQIDELKGGSNA